MYLTLHKPLFIIFVLATMLLLLFWALGFYRAVGAIELLLATMLLLLAWVLGF